MRLLFALDGGENFDLRPVFWLIFTGGMLLLFLLLFLIDWAVRWYKHRKRRSRMTWAASTCRMHSREIAGRTMFFSFLLFLLACFSPVTRLDGTPMLGWLVLIIGWITPIPWSANFLALFAFLLMGFRRYRAANRLAILATLLGLTSWVVEYRFFIGYYLWQGNFLLLAIGARLAAAREEEYV